MIELTGIHRTFTVGGQPVHALRDFHLAIAAGEYVAIMGASGSGKSTLLNLLGCLDRPTEGSYRFAGQEIARLSEHELSRLRRHQIGFVFQFFHLVPRLTAAGNVELPMVFAGIAPDERRERVRRALEVVGLSPRATHRPDQLSGGEQQRVAIARAVVMNPALLLADEPTGNLDTASGGEIIQLLEGMNARGLTLVVVTHDPRLGERARRRVRLSDGRLVSDEAQPGASPAPANPGGARLPPSHPAAEVHQARPQPRPTGPLATGDLPQRLGRRGGAVLDRFVPMRWSDLFRFAAGGLRGHRLRTSLSVLGVGIGVGSVILLTSLGEGARLYVTGEFASLGSNLLIFVPGKTETRGLAPLISTAPHDLTLEDAAALLERIPQIQRVAPVVLGSASVTAGELQRQVTVVGTTREMLEIRHLKMASGRFLPRDLPDAAVCVVGARVQRELFPGQNPLGQIVRIGDWRFRIIGVIAPRGTSIGMDLDEVVEIPAEAALRVFNRTSLFRIMAEVRSHYQLEPARRAALEVLRERHNGHEDVTILTQDSVLETFNQLLAVLTAALAGIAAVSLGVAGLGIMNVMLVAVSERGREVGLLKAVGVTNAQVIGVFLVEAAILSTAGGCFGLLVGLGAGRVLGRIYPDFPVQAPDWAIVVALIVSISVGLIFGILPARNAARLDPVNALMRRSA